MSAIVDPSEAILELGLSATITDEQRAVVAQAVRKAEGAVRRFLGYDPVQAVRTEYYPIQEFGAGRGPVRWEADANSAYLRRRARGAADSLQVRHLPVRAADEDGDNAIDLRIDYDGRFGTQSGAFAADTQKTEGTDFWPAYDGQDSAGRAVCRSGIVRSIGRWPQEPGSVKVVYVGGYTAAELRGTDGTIDASPIWAAVLDEVRRRFAKAFAVRSHAGVGMVGAPMESEKLGDYSYKINADILKLTVGGQWVLAPESAQALESFVNYGFQLGA